MNEQELAEFWHRLEEAKEQCPALSEYLCYWNKRARLKRELKNIEYQIEGAEKIMESLRGQVSWKFEEFLP